MGHQGSKAPNEEEWEMATREREAGAVHPVTLETSQKEVRQASSEFHEEECLGGRNQVPPGLAESQESLGPEDSRSVARSTDT